MLYLFTSEMAHCFENLESSSDYLFVKVKVLNPFLGMCGIFFFLNEVITFVFVNDGL